MMDPTQAPHLEVPVSAFMVIPVQIIILICLFLALIFNVTELILFTLFIITLNLGVYTWSRAALNHIKCDLSLNRFRIFPNERLLLDIQVSNYKILPALVKVDLFIPQSLNHSVKGEWVSEEIGLLWYQKTTFSRNLLPHQRGVYNLGPPRLCGSDLFGFYFRERKMENDIELIVYPRIVDIRPLAFPKKDFFGIPGKKSPIEDPVYIFGTRDYQPGRPARRIHWKASARYNHLQEKLSEPAEQEKMFFILDVEQFEKGQDDHAFEQTIEVIASLVLEMDRHGFAVGFATNGHIIGDKPKIVSISRSTGQVSLILETLSRVDMTDTLPVSDLISRGYRIPWGASTIYFCRNHTRQTHKLTLWMKKNNAAIRFVAVKQHHTDNKKDKTVSTDTIRLGSILVTENGDR